MIKLRPFDQQPQGLSTDVIIVPVVAQTPLVLTGPAEAVDQATGGQLTRLIKQGELTGKQGEIVTLQAPAGLDVKILICVGLGEADKLSTRGLLQAYGAAAKQASCKFRPQAYVYLPEQLDTAQTEAAIAGLYVGCHGQDLYRAEKKRHPFQELAVSGGTPEGLTSGQILAESVLLTRHLVNEPADVIYPETFAAEAERVASETPGLSVEIWDETRLQTERCGSLLAVAKGSSRPPRLVILRYQGASSSDAAPLALVGKGVTFDSGGLSLKPSDGMMGMKCDMAGAATVLGAMQAIARLKLPVNVIGLVGLVENMTGPAAMKLGDVLTARNGRTIEVHNTDAEGRLVLADVLSVAVDQGAGRIVDLATLTGACMVALGTDIAGLMTNCEDWAASVETAAQAAGEWVWQLPMTPEIFDEQISSDVADIKNVGAGRWGGTITAAKFLEQFVNKLPWVHLDIAGPAFFDKPKSWTDAGASGSYVRTLVEIARSQS